MINDRVGTRRVANLAGTYHVYIIMKYNDDRGNGHFETNMYEDNTFILVSFNYK